MTIPETMRAMVLDAPGRPLREAELPVPRPDPGQVLLKVHACGVCRTDLHLLDGEVDVPHPPRVPGHQIVGEVIAGDPPAEAETGGLVGVPWLGWTDGTCEYCRSGRENLCPQARFTGRDVDGGYAEYAVADARYCFPLPEGFGALDAAPLLCAGLIGYRALRMTGDAPRVGLYGFGSAAHILVQIVAWQGRRVFAFTRAGDDSAQAFARELGAEWAGASEELPPEPLDAAIIFAPVGKLVPLALQALAPGGIAVCGGIHMSDIPAFPYELLWMERTLTSVANLTRRDARELLALAPQVPIRTSVTRYALSDANRALEDLREGAFTGSAVIVPKSETR